MAKVRVQLDERYLFRLIGLGGVSLHENSQAQHYGRIFRFLMIAVSATLLFEWHLIRGGELSYLWSYLINLFVWSFFVIEAAVLISMVDDKLRYCVQNWFKFVIIFVGLVFVFDINALVNPVQELRPLLALVVLLPLWGAFINSMTDSSLITTLASAAVVVLIAGLAVTADPGIKNASDGVWWALVTVSTVGYGDFVPVSFFGRMLAAILILMGLTLFAVITANISAILIRRNIRELSEVKNTGKNLEKVAAEELEILVTLNKLEERLSSIEEKLEAKK